MSMLHDLRRFKERWFLAKCFPHVTAKILPEIHATIDGLVDSIEALIAENTQLQDALITITKGETNNPSEYARIILEELGHGRSGQNRLNPKMGYAARSFRFGVRDRPRVQTAPIRNSDRATK